MTDKDVVLAVIQALEGAGIPHMIVGSLASNVYGIARSTQDADFLIHLHHVPASDIASCLPQALALDPQMSFETVTGTSRFIIKLKGSHYKVELFLLGNDPHDHERFNRRVRGEINGHADWLPISEAVIITKLRWSKQGKRTKGIDDARNVIAVQGNALDWDYIHRWCDEHGTRELLEQIRAGLLQ